MKNVILLLCFIALYAGASAQDIQKQKEIGVSFSGLNHFGFTYRTGHDKAMWRIGSNFVHLSIASALFTALYRF